MRSIIRNHKDFAMPEEAPVFKTEYFIARARPTIWPGDAKYGITATKRTLKLAVDRNRAKRVLRVWIRDNEKSMSPKLDYVFIVRAGILKADFQAGKELMKTAMKKLILNS